MSIVQFSEGDEVVWYGKDGKEYHRTVKYHLNKLVYFTNDHHMPASRCYLVQGVTPTGKMKKSSNKYKVTFRVADGNFDADVYDVLMAFGITNPADAHAIKKMLMPGKRGVKSANQDREEAIASLHRAIELESE